MSLSTYSYVFSSESWKPRDYGGVSTLVAKIVDNAAVGGAVVQYELYMTATTITTSNELG